MNMRQLSCLGIVCAAQLICAAAHAQARVKPATQPTRQAPAPGVATFGLPSPAGLSSPVPAGLTPPTAPSLTPPDVPNLSSPGTAPGSPAIDAGIAAPASTGGGVAVPQYGSAAGTNAMGFGGAPRGPFSAADVARNFIEADLNRDGELTHAEAQRLAVPVPFDELDRNHDGILSRFEYDDFFE